MECNFDGKRILVTGAGQGENSVEKILQFWPFHTSTVY